MEDINIRLKRGASNLYGHKLKLIIGLPDIYLIKLFVASSLLHQFECVLNCVYMLGYS